jgi:hypothetical protein
MLLLGKEISHIGFNRGPVGEVERGGTLVEGHLHEVEKFVGGPVAEVALEDGLDQKVETVEVKAVSNTVIPVKEIIQ